MRHLAVLAEALAVVARDGDDRRAIARLARAQPRQHLADDGIVVRDLAVVGTIGERRRERRRRIVRIVRVVQVQPHEVRPRILRRHGEPALHRRRRLAAAALERQAIVVAIEASAEAVAPVQHERADERGGAIPGVVQRRRERRHRGVEREVAVVAHAVRERIPAGQQARVRRQRERRRRDRALEEDALRRQTIEIGRAGARVAVRAQMIGTRRVERDQENIGRRVAMPSKRRHERCGRQRRERRGTGGSGAHCRIAAGRPFQGRRGEAESLALRILPHALIDCSASSAAVRSRAPAGSRGAACR